MAYTIIGNSRSPEEIERDRKVIRDYVEELLASPVKARDFLMKLGCYDENGKIKPEYGGEPDSIVE